MNPKKSIQELINYHFNDENILTEALTHKSKIDDSSNEVLEFLGDRVLSLVITEKLIEFYPFDKEGVLDKKLSKLVNKDTCFEVAQKINLMDFIHLGYTELQSDGNKKKSILSNCCEALIGAIYKDGGYEQAKKFIILYWSNLIQNLNFKPIDSKSALQEELLKKYKKLPVYKTISKTGPDHDPVFCIEVSFENYISAKAEASTVKEAEKLAATKFLESNEI